MNNLLFENCIFNQYWYVNMMDIRKLDWSLFRSFLAVIDAGSLLGASKRLGTYQPTLSRQIYELEVQLGVALFERTGRGLVPTAAGLSIVDSARQMASAAQNVVSGLMASSSEEHGTVRISASEVVGNYLVPGSISELRTIFPNIEIDLVVTNQLSNLLRREADIALRMARPSQASVIAKKVADIPIGAYAAKAYVARRGTPSKLADLVKHDLLGMDTDESLIQGLNSIGIHVNRGSFVIRTDNQITYSKLIEEGCGIGFIPRFVADKLVNLQVLLPKATGVSIPLWLVVHREIKGNPIIRSVFDHLAESLPRHLRSMH